MDFLDAITTVDSRHPTEQSLEFLPSGGNSATSRAQSPSPQAATPPATTRDEAEDPYSPTDDMVQELMEQLPGFSREEFAKNKERINMLNRVGDVPMILETLPPYADRHSIHLGPNWFHQNPANLECDRCQRCNAIQTIPKRAVWTAGKSAFDKNINAEYLELRSFPPSRDLPCFIEFLRRPPNKHVVDVRNLDVLDMALCVLLHGQIFHLQFEVSGTLDKINIQSRMLSKLQEAFIAAEIFITPTQLAVYTRNMDGSFQYQSLTMHHIYPTTQLAGLHCHKFILTAVVTGWHIWAAKQYVPYVIRHKLGTPKEHHVLIVPGFDGIDTLPKPETYKAARRTPVTPAPVNKKPRARRSLTEEFDAAPRFVPPGKPTAKTVAKIMKYLPGNLSGGSQVSPPPGRQEQAESSEEYPEEYFSPREVSTPRDPRIRGPQEVLYSDLEETTAEVSSLRIDQD